MRPFDWSRDCPDAVGLRLWPAVVGTGRGELLAELPRCRPGFTVGDYARYLREQYPELPLAFNHDHGRYARSR